MPGAHRSMSARSPVSCHHLATRPRAYPITHSNSKCISQVPRRHGPKRCSRNAMQQQSGVSRNPRKCPRSIARRWDITARAGAAPPDRCIAIEKVGGDRQRPPQTWRSPRLSARLAWGPKARAVLMPHFAARQKDLSTLCCLTIGWSRFCHRQHRGRHLGTRHCRRQGN